MVKIAEKIKTIRPRFSSIIFGLLVILAVGMFMWAIKRFDFGTDWELAFKPATMVFLSGRSPYAITKFFNPPWLLLPMIPLILIPEWLGKTIFITIALASYIIVLHKLKANLAVTTFILLSPPVLYDIIMLNINWVVMLGYILPPQIGLFFVLVKPQVGGIVALYWLVESWRKGKLREVARVFLPVCSVILLTLLIYGPWFLRSQNVVEAWWNTSLFPFSISIGLVLAVVAFKTRQIRFAYMSTPFFFPYVGFYSWGTVLIGLAPSALETLGAVAGIWIAVLLSFI